MSLSCQHLKELTRLSLHSRLPLGRRLDLWPWLLGYVVTGWLCWEGYQSGEELRLLLAGLSLAAVALGQGISFLLAYWSAAADCFLRFRNLEANHVSTASHVFVRPVEHCGEAEICELHHEPAFVLADNPDGLFFEHQKVKYVWSTAVQSFERLRYPVDGPLRSFLRSGGIDTANVDSLKARFGLNCLDIPMPTFRDLFIEHAMAPFFVFQIVCVLLWLLDEYWYYALVTLGLLVMMEAITVKRRLKNFADVRGMRSKPRPVYVFRSEKWRSISSAELYPGDLVSIVRTRRKDEEPTVPCDVVLLNGTCVVNEAMLTGESLPQLKEALPTVASLPAPSAEPSAAEQAAFDVTTHKSAVVFAGTELLMHTRGNQQVEGAVWTAERIRQPPDKGCIAFVLRTAFNTSEGKLVRTISFGTQRVSVNNRDALLFIALLLCFATAASTYVLVHGLADPRRSRYKLLLNCVMIITSVVPPELPMELSLAVTTSLAALFKLRVFCTEPFRIPLAGNLDVCCFDKTGTLTADTFRVEGIAAVKKEEKEEEEEEKEEENKKFPLCEASHAPLPSRIVVGGCHSLAYMPEGGLLGDPLEKTAFEACGWVWASGDVACLRKWHSSARRAAPRVRTLRRFAFSSTLRRMSCLVSLDHLEPPEAQVVAKGAAEVMKPLFDPETLPADFDDTNSYYARRGCRVLALGWRSLGTPTPAERRDICLMAREEAESNLTFAGFLVLSCPLKPDSKETCQQLANSGHNLVMITGDHILTACHVAAELGITGEETSQLLLIQQGEALFWQNVDQTEIRPFNGTPEALRELAQSFDLCVPGPLLRAIAPHTAEQARYSTAEETQEAVEGDAREGTAETVCTLCAVTKVFARVSPDQKEFILARLKQSGLSALMCGDGTNDVGALKQAHVGVALLPPRTETSRRKKAPAAKEQEKPQKEQAAPRRKTVQQVKRGTKKQHQVKRRAGLAKKEAANAKEDKRNEKGKEKKKKSVWDELKVEEEEAPLVRLGDASIAAPFTAKATNIKPTVALVRLGRCTLVTTQQMYQILALNCLISAYSMSVLYLDGVKFGDTQASVVGIGVALLFFAVSRAKPLDELAPHRPPSSVFSPSVLLSIVGQFVIHFYVLLTAVKWAKEFSEAEEEPDQDFKPTVLNSVVFIVSSAMVVVTFAANYRGQPFMEDITMNQPLLYLLVALDLLMFACALNVVPGLNEFMELAPFPSVEFSGDLVVLMLFDLIGAVAFARAVIWLLESPVKPKVVVPQKEKDV